MVTKAEVQRLRSLREKKHRDGNGDDIPLEAKEADKPLSSRV